MYCILFCQVAAIKSSLSRCVVYLLKGILIQLIIFHALDTIKWRSVYLTGHFLSLRVIGYRNMLISLIVGDILENVGGFKVLINAL